MKKYFMSLLYIFAPILIIGILLTIMYYFDIIGYKLYCSLNSIFVFLSCLIGGIYLGKKCNKQGWVSGLKLSSLICLLFFLISYLGFDHISIKTIFYYLLIIGFITLGSMFGISQKKDNKKK